MQYYMIADIAAACLQCEKPHGPVSQSDVPQSSALKSSSKAKLLHTAKAELL